MAGKSAGSTDTAVQALAEELRRLRECSGLTLRELEEATFTSDSALSRYLQGRTLAPWPVVETLCRLGGGQPDQARSLWRAAKSARIGNRLRQQSTEKGAAEAPTAADVAPEAPDIAAPENAELSEIPVPAEACEGAEPAGSDSGVGDTGTGAEIAARTVVAPFEPDVRLPAGFERDVIGPPTPLGWRRKAVTIAAVISVIGAAVGVTFLQGPRASDPYAGPPHAGTPPAGTHSAPVAPFYPATPLPGLGSLPPGSPPGSVVSHPFSPPSSVRPPGTGTAPGDAGAPHGDGRTCPGGQKPAPDGSCPQHQQPVAPPPAEAARRGWWRLDQASGQAVTDVSGSGFDATATGDVSWVSGRGTRVARLGGTGEIATQGSVLRTEQSFSVAAWVRLADDSQWGTAVSQDGGRASAFYLQYNKDDKRWAFSRPLEDANAVASVRVNATEPVRLNTWTHLTGVYDAAAAELRLYVNGTHTASRPFIGGWHGNGPLRIGRAMYYSYPSDWWHGDLADVTVFRGALSPADIQKLATNTS